MLLLAVGVVLCVPVGAEAFNGTDARQVIRAYEHGVLRLTYAHPGALDVRGCHRRGPTVINCKVWAPDLGRVGCRWWDQARFGAYGVTIGTIRRMVCGHGRGV